MFADTTADEQVGSTSIAASTFSSTTSGSPSLLPSQTPVTASQDTSSTSTSRPRFSVPFNAILGSTSKVIDLDSDATVSSFTDFSILQVNIRGWRSHCDELSAYINLLDSKPQIVAINESFLNKSVPAVLPGYCLVGRRDRTADVNAHLDQLQSFGGILLFVTSELLKECGSYCIPT